MIPLEKNKHFLRRLLALLLILLTVASPVLAANGDITVLLNGTALEFDVPPQILNGRTMVPMRKIFESLGAVVTWDAQSRTATGRKGDTVVNVSVDSTTLFKNGVPITLDVPPKIINNRTLVPVRAIAESFDCAVDWLASTRTVTIVTDNTAPVKTALNASEVSEKLAPSVFYIEVCDRNDQATASGSGFFVTSDGVAVTNYHVIDGTASAYIRTVDNRVFPVTHIIAYDEALDVAILKISRTDTDGRSVAGFPAVTLADSDQIKAGQRIYTLGSPKGLQNTISDGIISNVKQTVDGSEYIQITAPISHGSSGGALADEYGEVLGITSAGVENAENIGFAIPINRIRQFDLNAAGITYSQFAGGGSSPFVLELSPTSLSLEVGKSGQVMVHAEGKGDWSVYCHIDDTSVVDCEWGDWLTGNSSVCPLYVKGLRAGTTTVTVYSDLDFAGKTFTVKVTQQAADSSCYPGTNIPTYTSVTGVALKSVKDYENNRCYAYDYSTTTLPQKYVDRIQALGYRYLQEDDDGNTVSYYYVNSAGELISVTLARRWKEVWIFIAK